MVIRLGAALPDFLPNWCTSPASKAGIIVNSQDLTSFGPPADLEKIGFCLIASDFFSWDGDTPDGARVAETAHDWSAPEVNYQLTVEIARKFRSKLLFGRDEFTASDHYRKEANQPVQTTRTVARPERLT